MTDGDCETVISSFLPDALAEVTAVPTALAVREAEGAVERAAELGCSMLHPILTVFTSSLVERAHESGVEVNGWTVVDPEETADLRGAGADGVITDFPGCCPSGE